jgi:hypothetical protein
VTTEPSPSNPHNDPGREEDRASPEPNDLLRRAELRAQHEVRDFVRELHKKAALGAAFESGKIALREIWDLLSDS